MCGSSSKARRKEFKALDLEVSKRKRGLTDAELRRDKAESRANPKFDPSNMIASLVGPFEIQQVVLHWIEHDREVDIEQVDRCHTCHMGAGSNNYLSAAIPRQRYVRDESASFIDRVFGGETTPALMHFVRSSRMSQEEIDELRRILDQKTVEKAEAES